MSDATQLRLELAGNKEFGPCEHCGKMTKRVWGYVYEGDAALAAYSVEWTPGHADSEAFFNFIIGHWGEDTSAQDRKAVSLAYRQTAHGPEFMVIDARSPFAESSLVSEALSRQEVIGTQLAPEVFAISDAVYLLDPRIAKIRE